MRMRSFFKKYDEQGPLRHLLIAAQKRNFGRTSSGGKKRSEKSNVAAAVTTFFSNDGSMPLLFDVDCNLTHKDLIEDVDEHVSAAVRIGVGGMIVPSMTIDEARECLKIYRKFNSSTLQIRTTVGIHPYTAKEFISDGQNGPQDATMQTMRDMILDNRDAISAIGECGLDYSSGFPDKSIQIPCFEEHLKLSSELKMPLYIHQRGAFKDFVDLMDKYRNHLEGIPVLVHCFTGSKDELEWILERPNFFISVSGFICKPKHGSELRKLLSNQRYQQDYDLLNRIMIETDAPYLGFPNCRAHTSGDAKSRRKQYPNVPTSLPLVAKTLSECLGIEQEIVAVAGKRNAEIFFGISID